MKRCSPFVALSFLFAAACGRSENKGALSGDASLAGEDGSVSNEPSCIVGLSPFVAPAYAAPLAVEPRVLWTKPFAFASYLEHPNSPLVVTQDRIVLATQTAVYLYDRSGTLVVRRPLFGLDGGRVPLIAAPDGSIYVGSEGLDRIDKDGTSFRYFTSGKSIHAPDGEGGSWVSGIARDPTTERIYAVATDGWLRVVARAGENIAPVYLTTEPLSSAPTVLGIGDTLLIQGTLFHKDSGLRIGPSFVGNNGEVSFSLDAHGRRMIAPIASHIPAFRFVDSCRQPIATIPQFGATARPTMTTFQDETLWAEGVAAGESRYSVRIHVTNERGDVVRSRLDFRAWPIVLGADGTLYSLGKEDGKPFVLATDEQFVERWRLPLANEGSYVVGLGDDGVLVVNDGTNKTFTAIQTTSPGFAPVARALADPTGAPRTPQNWIGGE